MPAANSPTFPTKPKRRSQSRKEGKAVRKHRPSTEERKLHRHDRRRGLRDRQSLNLEDCSEDCQDQGYHWDADVSIGCANDLNRNPYSVLDSMYLSPSNHHDDNTMSIKQFDELVEKHYPDNCSTTNPISSGSKTASQDNMDTPSLSGSTQTQTLTFAGVEEHSHEHPKTRLPQESRKVSLQCECPASMLYRPYSLLDHCIPSPLLYHKRSREMLSSCMEDQTPFYLDSNFPPNNDTEESHGESQVREVCGSQTNSRTASDQSDRTLTAPNPYAEIHRGTKDNVTISEAKTLPLKHNMQQDQSMTSISGMPSAPAKQKTTSRPSGFDARGAPDDSQDSLMSNYVIVASNSMDKQPANDIGLQSYGR